MATIMCAQKLWQVVRRWKHDAAADPPPSRLGSWAATRFTEDDLDVAIAMSEQAYLTLVVPLRSPGEFTAAFRQMLEWALQDLGIPAADIERECAAVRLVHWQRLQEPALRDALSHAQCLCGIELSYMRELRAVQRNLNEVPHQSLKPHYVPSRAVRCLLRVARPLAAYADRVTVH